MNTPTLSDILSRKLEQKRENHPSFKLMKIDDRLFPNAQTMNSTLVLEARDSNNEPKTVREIVAESWEKGSKNHLMIEGEGGIGKTVTLLSIPNKFTPFPVPAIYIPLHELSKGDDPIEGYIRKKILNGKAALYEQLLDLIDQTWDKGPHLLLLLDGFNEIAAENRQIISEDIGHWSEYPGIQIVTSSRYDIHTYVALSYDYSTIKLQPLSDRTVEDYLSSASIPIPADSAVKKLITIPLLLTLYVKTELIIKQKETDSSCFWEAKNAGSIVWNYLQCELWNFGKEGEDAKNAIIAMEFIAPYIAWRMQQKTLFVLKKKEFHDFLKEAYQLLEKHFDKTEAFPFHISDAIQKSNGIPPLDLIRSLLENKLCLFVKSGNEYRLMHQQFRDALAAMHLINSIYLNGNSRPTEWNPIVDHYVMQFVADLIGEDEANRLWEQNRTSPQLEFATRNQLELQRRLHNCDFSKLNFSGLDLSNISLYPYRIGKTILKLPTDADKLKEVKLSERTFSPEGHEGGVYTVALTPDGRRIVSGSHDNTIRVWDLDSGIQLRIIKGYADWVNAITITPDGKCIVSTLENTICVWDLDTGVLLRVFEGHEDGVEAIAVTSDGMRIVSGAWDNTIRVWDIDSGIQLRAIEGHKAAVNALALTPDGKRIVSGSNDHTIRVWDLETGAPIGSPIEGHDSWVDAVAVTPDGKRIVSRSMDNTIRVWDIDSGIQLRAIEGLKAAGKAIAVTPDGKRIVGGSRDNTICVWNIETGLPIGKPIEGHKRPANVVAITPDGKRIVSGSDDNTIRVWDLETGTQLKTIEGHEDWVNAIAMTPDGKHIVSASLDDTIRAWNLDTRTQLRVIEEHTGRVSAIALTPDGKCIVSGSNDHTIRVWDLETGIQIRAVIGNKDWGHVVALTPDGKRIVSCSTDQTLLWDLDTCTQLKVIKRHKDSMAIVTMTTDGKRFVSWSPKNTVHIWDLDSGIQLRVIEGPGRLVTAFALTSDCKCIIYGTLDNTIRVWELETGAQLRIIEGHEDWVEALALTPDGKRILSGSMDNTIRVWDLESGECLTTIRIHPLSFVGLDFSKAEISDAELKETLRQNGAKV